MALRMISFGAIFICAVAGPVRAETPAAFDAWAGLTQILPVQGRIDRPASHDMISRPVFLHPAIDVQALPTVGPQSPPDVVAVLDRIQRRPHPAGC